MTITFPRALPSDGVNRHAFEIQRVDYLSPEGGGRLGAVTAGFPLWTLRLGLGPLAEDGLGAEWGAFIDSLRGPQKLFYGGDLVRPWPKAYPTGFAGLTRAGGGAFDGTATSWSVDGTRSVLTLNGLPAGFVIAIRDGVMLRWTTSSAPRRAVTRAIEATTASGGGVATFSIEPPLASLVPGGAVADLDHPVCLMKMVASESRLDDQDEIGDRTGAFVGLQELLA